jgi:hypothetical protein
MAGFLPPAVFEIKAIADEAIAKFKDVNKELDKMGGEADKAGGKVDKLSSASKAATAGLFALGAAFVGFAAYGIKEATEAEQVMTSLGQTMSNVGVNTEANRKQVEALADSYIQLGFADDEAAAGMDTLLRATGDLQKSQDLLALSADYARAKHISLADATAVIGKASMGGAKAFREMGITLDTSLPKAQAVDKAMKELAGTVGGQAQAYTKTFAGQMAIMKEEFNNTAETLGTALIPILTSAMTLIRNGVKFIKEHSTAFQILGGVILTITIALAAYNVAVKTQMALTKTWTAITTIHKTVTAMLTGQQLALNGAMAINPIALVVAAVVALIGVFVILWNKFEGFRKGVIAVGKAGLMAFASIIPIIGQVGETILKFVLTPMKTLLSALSHLPGVGKYAKAGLDLLNKGLDGVSNFADTAAAKAKSLAANLDKLNKPISIGLDFSGGGITETGNKGGAGGKGLAGEDAKTAAAAAKKANDDYLAIVKDLNKKLADVNKSFNETMAKAQKNYDEDVAKAQADYNEAKLKAEEAYAETTVKLTEKKNEDLAKLALDNQTKVAEITKAGQDKLQAIVQQSIDRLRDAFKRGTEFNVSDLFKGLADAGKQSADGLLDALKSRLTAAKDLAANAAKLQAAGFSQTFIEQVVAAGPEVGNGLTDAILKAKPETVKELQDTYVDLERLTNTGMDRLATTMNAGANLATEELKQAYAQANSETAQMLQAQATSYKNAQAEIVKQFDKDMADAMSTRDRAIADAQKALDKAMADANKALAEAQAAARKQLSEDLAAIQQEFDEKLGNIKSAIASTIAQIQALQAALALSATQAIPTAPATPKAPETPKAPATPFTPVNPTEPKAFVGPIPLGTTRTATGYVSTGSVNTTTLAGILKASGSTYNTNVVANTNASPYMIAQTATAASKLQSTVTVTSSTGVSNKIKSMGMNIL